MDTVLDSLEGTGEGLPVWPYCRQTGYNIVVRAGFHYPHYFRLNRVTQLLRKGFSSIAVRSWTGLNLRNVEYYAGLVELEKMGASIEDKMS